MKNVCLYFQVHQPFRNKKYSFFEMGKEHYYYDDFMNENQLRKIARNSYVPTCRLLERLIEENKGKFKVALSISGTALDQFEMYSPAVLESFKRLADTGCVEFLGETYSHSLVSLYDKDLFEKQVKKHSKRIKDLFGQKPKVFRNTELIYSDMIGKDVYEMGFKGMLTEGAKHILGWKTPNYLYSNTLEPRLKLLLRNYKLSDDIAFRFSNQSWNEFPLTSEKYAQWIADENEEHEIINIFMDFESFGEHQKAETGIFGFMENLPKALLDKKIKFITPSEAVKKLNPVSPISMPYPISWADEERDTSAWLGNEMQKEAFEKLYSIAPMMEKCKDEKLQKDWEYLQTSDAFYYMSTKWYTDGDVHAYFNPYPSPYDAFINYMNILGDFANEVEKATSGKKESEVEMLKKELKKTKDKIKKYEDIMKSL